jgi:hypothetical protein
MLKNFGTLIRGLVIHVMPVSPLSDTQLAVLPAFGSAVKESTPSIMRMASSSVISFRGLGHPKLNFIAVLNIRPELSS